MTMLLVIFSDSSLHHKEVPPRTLLLNTDSLGVVMYFVDLQMLFNDSNTPLAFPMRACTSSTEFQSDVVLLLK